ncbi:hypothetical protein OCK72_06700 [Fusobacterium simiae]|uniref:Uncharacterized protein n=1 Tax=Fusobacterium simiae TaxID=855 RepID=A0ABT4DK44_FUSSI|nr:hypothetical protein [Fusobacterium simiae]MCY7008343.1 hypothetical protein [Fusobacterium simiae]
MLSAQLAFISALIIIFSIIFYGGYTEDKNIIKRTIKKQKPKYVKTCFYLTAGIYTVGVDFPEGKYKLTAKQNYGDVTTSNNVKNEINQTLGVGYKNIASVFNNLILENGDTLTIDGELILEFYSEKVNASIAQRKVAGQEINLVAGNYICGTDFKVGTYDIELIENYGYVTVRNKKNISYIKFRKFFGEDDNQLKKFKNCSIINGDKLEVSGSLYVKLTPSKSNYIYD